MNLTNTLGAQFFLSDKLKPFGLPVAILMLMVMMVVPLPSMLLDVFFTTNILLSLLILMVSIHTFRPLDFSSFPTVLLFATILRLYDFPMPPLILAFVLGGLMEENLRRSLLISDGSWAFLWDRPLTLCIMILILTIVSWQIYDSFKFRKR